MSFDMTLGRFDLTSLLVPSRHDGGHPIKFADRPGILSFELRLLDTF